MLYRAQSLSMTLFSALAIAALYAAILLPLGLVVRRPDWARPVALGYAILLASLVTYHVGMFRSPALPDLKAAERVQPQASDAQCTEILTLLASTRTIVDRSRPPLLVVAESTWSAIPEDGRAVVIQCVQRGWPQGTAPAQVEVRR